MTETNVNGLGMAYFVIVATIWIAIVPFLLYGNPVESAIYFLLGMVTGIGLSQL